MGQWNGVYRSVRKLFSPESEHVKKARDLRVSHDSGYNQRTEGGAYELDYVNFYIQFPDGEIFRYTAFMRPDMFVKFTEEPCRSPEILQLDSALDPG